ncbi:MAG: hypothetical protein R3B99_24635 [Polyangiales bacterium]
MNVFTKTPTDRMRDAPRRPRPPEVLLPPATRLSALFRGERRGIARDAGGRRHGALVRRQTAAAAALHEAPTRLGASAEAARLDDADANVVDRLLAADLRLTARAPRSGARCPRSARRRRWGVSFRRPAALTPSPRWCATLSLAASCLDHPEELGLAAFLSFYSRAHLVAQGAPLPSGRLA